MRPSRRTRVTLGLTAVALLALTLPATAQRGPASDTGQSASGSSAGGQLSAVGEIDLDGAEGRDARQLGRGSACTAATPPCPRGCLERDRDCVPEAADRSQEQRR
jgi:hypothetical protein